MTATEERSARRLALDVFVPGPPAVKGNLTGFRMGTRVRLVEKSGDHQRAWAAKVGDAAHQHWAGGPAAVAMTVELEFVMPRRATAPKRSTPAHTRKPDIDKLTRCVLDALTAIVYADDGQVDDLRASKREAEPGETPGCRIRIYTRPTET